jgi:integrase
MRRGEVCGLRWADVDLEAGRLSVTQQLVQSGRDAIFGPPKTRKGLRTIGLDASTVQALRTHRAAQAAERLALGPRYNTLDLVFCQEDGTPLNPDGFSRRFLALCRTIGVPRIVFHGLRHGHATHALVAGVPITVVANRLGHSRSSFTADTYTRVLDEVDQQAADLVADVVMSRPRTSQAGTP